MEAENKDATFSVEKVIEYTTAVMNKHAEIKDIVCEDFFNILHQFCRAFKLFNKFLGIAFSDVKDKVRVMTENNQRFPGHQGFFSFVKMEMEKGIEKYNTSNNKDLKAPKEFEKYDSTGRNLLRMMWLLTFIRVTFEGMRDISANMSDILCKAYDAAFGDAHSFVVRGGAKLAIKATSDRKEFVRIILNQKEYDEMKFAEVSKRFMEKFVPLHEAMWGFYRENKLTELP